MTVPSARRFENIRDVGHGTSEHLRLIRCPACGIDLDGMKPSCHFHTEHTPADFGLGVADE